MGTKQLQLVVFEIIEHRIISKPNNFMQHHKPLEMTSNLANIYLHGKLIFQLGQSDIICLVAILQSSSKIITRHMTWECHLKALSISSSSPTDPHMKSSYMGINIWLSKIYIISLFKRISFTLS